MSTVFTPVELLKTAFTKGHLRTNGPCNSIRVIGFHLYNENSVIVNLLRKLFVNTKIMGAKPIMMLVLDGSSFIRNGRCNVWTASSQDGDVFRIVHVDDAYDIFAIMKNHAVEHVGTARSVYFPKPVPRPSNNALALTLNKSAEDEARDLMSHVILSARSYYSSSSG